MTTTRVTNIARKRANAYDDERYARMLAVMTDLRLDHTPLADYLINEFLPAYELEVEPTTYRSAVDTVHTFINPHLGAIPVSELSRTHLRGFHWELLHTPVRRGSGFLKKKTVMRIHAILSAGLQRLVDTGRLPANPAYGARPRLKKSEVYEPVIWTPGQLRHFLESAAEDELYPLWNLIAFTGMRRGEALALQGGDLSVRYTHVAVKRALGQVRSTRYLSAPKGTQARRIDLLPDTIRALRAYRRKQMRWVRHRDGSLGARDFIFTFRSGKPLSLGTATKRFMDLVAGIDLPRIRLHDLRHTHASHLLEAGASVKAVQERLGHHDAAFTMESYVHSAPTIQRDAIKSLQAYYRKARD